MDVVADVCGWATGGRPRSGWRARRSPRVIRARFGSRQDSGWSSSYPFHRECRWRSLPADIRTLAFGCRAYRSGPCGRPPLPCNHHNRPVQPLPGADEIANAGQTVPIEQPRRAPFTVKPQVARPKVTTDVRDSGRRWRSDWGMLVTGSVSWLRPPHFPMGMDDRIYSFCTKSGLHVRAHHPITLCTRDDGI
jgi:hypothetical protein